MYLTLFILTYLAAVPIFGGVLVGGYKCGGNLYNYFFWLLMGTLGVAYFIGLFFVFLILALNVVKFLLFIGV